MGIISYVFLHVVSRLISVNRYYYFFLPSPFFKVKKVISDTILTWFKEAHFFTFQYVWNRDAYDSWWLPAIPTGLMTVRISLSLTAHLWNARVFISDRLLGPLWLPHVSVNNPLEDHLKKELEPGLLPANLPATPSHGIKKFPVLKSAELEEKYNC